MKYDFITQIDMIECERTFLFDEDWGIRMEFKDEYRSVLILFGGVSLHEVPELWNMDIGLEGGIVNKDGTGVGVKINTKQVLLNIEILLHFFIDKISPDNLHRIK